MWFYWDAFKFPDKCLGFKVEIGGWIYQNCAKCFKKHSLHMQAIPDDGLGKVQKRLGQIW